MTSWTWLIPLILAAWVAVSVPAGLLIGKVLARNSRIRQAQDESSGEARAS